MDNLTSGVRKIKLNIMTQAKREAQEKARLESLKESTPQPAAPSASEGLGHAPTSTDMESISPTQTSQLPPLPPNQFSGLSTPVQAEAPSSGTMTPEGYSRLDSSPAVPCVAVQPSSDPADMFIPYQPEGPDPVTMPQQEPLRWLPANSAATPAATPSPMKKQDHLFRYTSGIPFAGLGQEGPKKPDMTFTSGLDVSAGEGKSEQGESPSAWDLPESPRKEP